MASTNDLVTDSVADLTQNKLDHEEKKEKTFRTMSMKERVTYVKELITIEPLLICYIMSSLICTPALLTLEFEKACRANEGFNKSICDAIIGDENSDIDLTNETASILIRVSDMHSWQLPVQSIMPIILVLFLGSYSDRHKIRKPFLLIPIIGEFFAVIGCILCVIFMEEWPLEALGFVQTVVPSFLGGPTMILMACFAYIADVSTIEMRTLRIGIVQIFLNITTPIVQSFSGHLFVALGYIGVLLIAGVLFAIGLIYGYFLIKEPHQPVDIDNKKGLIKDLFDPRNALETSKVLTKETKGNRRIDIWIIMLILFVFSGVGGGEGSVFYGYSLQLYKWTAVEYSYFISVNTVIHLVGNIIALPLFTRIFKLHDATITIITFLDKILCNFIIIIFVSVTGLYAGAIISIVTGFAAISIRSQATKVVAEDDLGKAQSIFAIVESIAPAIIGPLYNQVYAATLFSYSQTYFFLAILLYGIGIAFLLWMYIRDKKRTSKEKSAATNEAMELDITKNGNIIEATHM